MTKIPPALLLALGLGLWVWSLFLPTFYPASFEPPHAYGHPDNGLRTLCGGFRAWWLLLLIPFGWGWWANPLMLAGLMAWACRRFGVAMVLGVAALLLAQISWFYFLFPAGNEGDLSPPALTGGSTGFFVWDVALALMFAGLWLQLWRSLPADQQAI